MFGEIMSCFAKWRVQVYYPVIVICLSINFKECSGAEWLDVVKVTRDPVFVNVGESLRLQINLYSQNFDENNTTGVWEISRRSDLTSDDVVKKDLAVLRRIGRADAFSDLRDARVKVKRQADLFMENTTLNDTGEYTFLFKNGSLSHPWNMTVKFHVTVEVRPKVELTCADTVSLKKGERFSCKCKATTLGRLVPNVSWVKKGKKMSRKISHSNQELSFEHFSKDIAGSYICRANIGTLVDEKTVEISFVPQVQKKTKKYIKGWGKMQIIMVCVPIGASGILLGIITTLGIQWTIGKLKKSDPEYEEPGYVKPAEYQQLDVDKMNQKEHAYQTLQLDRTTRGNQC